DAVLRIDQVVGKSIALRRSVLDEIGGWYEFKDVLAEDHVMGTALKRLGLHSAMCPSPVLNVQRDKGLSHFWERNSRWAMIRFRVLVPGVLAEPLLNTTALTFAAAAVAGDSVSAWAVAAGGALFSTAYTQAAAHLARGYGFKSWHLPLVPLRDMLFLLTWLHGATMREVSWRGNRFRVLAKTRLAPSEAVVASRRLKEGEPVAAE
ncbi:MAG: glycosyltransferase family 2 protein, partial [Myxococcaceae bacterium]